MADTLLKALLPEKARRDLEVYEESEEYVDYWAGADCEDVVEAVLDRKRTYERTLDHSALFNKIWRSLQYYYGFFDGEEDWGDTAIQVSGEHGQILTFTVNMYRYVIRQLLTMVTSEPPNYRVVPANIETKSRVQARLGERVLNYYLHKKKFLQQIQDTVEDALVYGTGFLEIYWDPSLGESIFGEDDEGATEEFFEGDVALRRRDFLDVVWECDGKDDDAELRWVALRDKGNKYDLATRYPDMAEKILSLSATQPKYTDNELEQNESDTGVIESDDIYYYRFYHRKSDALPEGRLVFFLEEFPEEPLIDMDLPYSRIPLLWIRISKLRKTLLGWSPAFDIQKQQELINETLAKLATIQDNLGLPILWAGGKGVEQPDPDLWVGNIAWVESEKKPEVINLGVIPPEMFKTLEVCVNSMEKSVGLNAAVQGQTAGSLRANRMQVFLAEQSLRFNSDVEQAFFRLFENVGTLTLEILQDFPESERLITVIGRENEDALVSFAAEDLYNVTGVNVQPGSRVARTTEGRMEILNILSQMGIALPKEEIVAIVNGAPIEAVTAGVEGQTDLAQAENESLMQGGFHKALFSDNHIYHMKKHAQVLNSPIARSQSNVVRGVLKAMMDHATLYNDPKVFEFQTALGYAEMPPSPGGGGPQKPGGPARKALPAPKPQGGGAPTGGQAQPPAGGEPGIAGSLPERMSNAEQP